MSWRRRLTYALIALLVGGLLVWGFLPSPELVETEPVTYGTVAATVEEEGRTRVRDHYVVSAPITAHARRITLEAGDSVAEGEALVTLDPPASPVLDRRQVAEARARVAAAESTLEGAEAELEAVAATARFAAAEHLRMQRLDERELVSPEQVDRARAEAQRTAALERSAQFQVRVAEADLAAAEAALAYVGEQDPEVSGTLTLRAPVAGQILRRHFESARVVQPGEPILEIGDPAALEVEVEVLSSDAVRMAAGTEARLERWGDEPLEARVRRVEPGAFTKISALGVEEQRVLVILDITSPKERWQRLGDAYRVNARFFMERRDDVLRVPNTALFREGEAWAAFVVENGRARLRQVEVGVRGDRYTVVESGLAESDDAIVHPGRDVADGVRVQPR